MGWPVTPGGSWGPPPPPPPSTPSPSLPTFTPDPSYIDTTTFYVMFNYTLMQYVSQFIPGNYEGTQVGAQALQAWLAAYGVQTTIVENLPLEYVDPASVTVGAWTTSTQFPGIMYSKPGLWLKAANGAVANVGTLASQFPGMGPNALPYPLAATVALNAFPTPASAPIQAGA